MRHAVRRLAPFALIAIAAASLAAATVGAESRKKPAPQPVLHAKKATEHDAADGSSPAAGALLQALVDAKAVAKSRLGVAVYDLETGRYTHVHAHDVALNPASNAKLLTAAAALGLLGGGHTFATTVTGALEGGTVHGPLVLRGHGDPSFSSADVASLSEQMAANGVRSIKGSILVDQGFFDDSFVPPAFEQQENEWAPFRASTSALALDGNTVTLIVAASERGKSAVVRVEPEGAALVEGEIRCDSGTGDSPQLELRAEADGLHAKVSGSIRPGHHSLRYVRRAHDPRLLVGHALKRSLGRLGIAVEGGVALGSAPETRLIAEHVSQPLAALLFRVGKESDNFYAEMIFRTLDAEKKGKRGVSADAAHEVQAFVEGIGAGGDGLSVTNGSGLFDANRVSASMLARLLSWAWREPSVHPEFVSLLAVGGVDGTLRSRFKDAELRGRIRAKTGTLEHAASLAGYILRPDGRRPVVFALIANDVNDVPGARVAFDTFVRGVLTESDASFAAPP